VPASVRRAEPTDPGLTGRALRLRRPPDERVDRWASVPCFAVPALCLAAVLTEITPTALILFVGLFVGHAIFVTTGYHRYFSHKAYTLNRFWQFVWAFMAKSTGQKGVLWWGANHRQHHRFSDTEHDPHSPRKGFWWSHVGWILCHKYKAPDYVTIKDFARYPELRWIDERDWIAPWLCGLLSFLVGGWSGLVVGFFWSTVLLWHTTFLDQLRQPRVRAPPLRDDRHQPQLIPDRARHRRRRLAPQPSPLPGVGPPGILLVGSRSHLVLPQAGPVAGHRAPPEAATGSM
jgi:hypothetical protein